MGYDYDKLYAEQKDALGAPSELIQSFFKALPKQPLRVLDVGCGQGRDAIFIAELGHQVLGLDTSPHGIADLNSAADQRDLPIRGEVADVSEYKPTSRFDVLLFDRVLHMLDAPLRIRSLQNLLPALDPNGYCIIADERPNIAALKETMVAHCSWQFHHEKAGNLIAQAD